jgi:CheY-like chemotaxis protein
VVLAAALEGEGEVEALQAGLGREVVTLDPALLDAEAFARVGAAAAVIVPWDLGSQAGLDVVEALRSDELTRNTPIVMSSAAPTRAAVRLALRAGATGFIFEPYRAEDIRPHLVPVAPAQDGAEAASAEEP